MDIHQRTLRVGLTAILWAAAFRLFAVIPALPWQMPEMHGEPSAGQTLETEETRLSRFVPDFVETPVPTRPQTEAPVFSDAGSVEVFYASSVRPALEELIRQPLQWQLTSGKPAVLILHTHTTESYTRQGEAYRETAAYRTLEGDYNMLSIGDRVARILTEQGIRVIHDRTVHDYPSYNGSYSHARKSIQDYLARYPSIQLILDLHRDASDGTGGQLRTLAATENCAQLMVVIGTNHEGFEENLSLGLKLHAQLETQSPGITRPLQLRRSRFNQDLLPGALLVEVGAAGNSHPEAMAAAEQLAQAVIALSKGTGTKEEAGKS